LRIVCNSFVGPNPRHCALIGEQDENESTKDGHKKGSQREGKKPRILE